MRFKKAKLENVGCADFSNCPKQHARCCLFCIDKCLDECEVTKIFYHQTSQWREKFDCPRLTAIEVLAWRYLLGSNVPQL